MSTLDEPLVESLKVESPIGTLMVVILRVLFWPAFGAVLAFVLLTKVILPITGVGSVERIVQLGRHLNAPFEPQPTIAFLGNSITREGVETRLVEKSGPIGWHAQNLAISACGLSEIRVQMPKVLAARPAAVAFGVRPEDLGRLDDLEIDKAFAYALGGFVAAWPASWTRADLPGIGPETYQALRSDKIEQELHFRTAPLNLINSEVRLRFRKGLRRTAADNWVDPYELNFNVRDQRLTHHVEGLRRNMAARMDGDDGTRLTATLAAEIRRAGATPVLIVLPMHPLFRDDYQASIDSMKSVLERIAREHSGLIIDALDLLSAEDFADALHPNAEGREKYSHFLGQQLGALAEVPSR